MSGFLTVNGKPVAVDSFTRAAPHGEEHGRAARYRIKVGQRFHRVGYTAVVWRAISVYHDAVGVEHAALIDEGGRLDEKTLSASVLLDRAHYRMI